MASNSHVLLELEVAPLPRETPRPVTVVLRVGTGFVFPSLLNVNSHHTNQPRKWVMVIGRSCDGLNPVLRGLVPCYSQAYG